MWIVSHLNKKFPFECGSFRLFMGTACRDNGMLNANGVEMLSLNLIDLSNSQYQTFAFAQDPTKLFICHLFIDALIDSNSLAGIAYEPWTVASSEKPTKQHSLAVDSFASVHVLRALWKCALQLLFSSFLFESISLPLSESFLSAALPPSSISPLFRL